ncbi:hypothetical protein ACE6H2_004270 [Prunus campanulata]
MACVLAILGFREDGSEDEKEVLEIEVNEVLWRRMIREERREGSTLPQEEGGCYRTLVENQQVYIHPSSALFQKQPDWVIYHELVMTSKEYMHARGDSHRPKMAGGTGTKVLQICRG